MTRMDWTTKGIAVAAVAVMVSGGAAVAVASSTSQSFKACASSKHVLSVESHGKCPKHTAKVTLGARGKTGKPGKNGKNGHNGAVGPSNAYSYEFNGNSGSPTNGTPPALNDSTSAALFTLPAGSYLVHMDITVDDSADANSGYVACNAVYAGQGSSGSDFDIGLAATNGVGGANDFSTGVGSITEPLVVTVPTSVAIHCLSVNNLVSPAVISFDATAVQVSSLTTSGYVP